MIRNGMHDQHIVIVIACKLSALTIPAMQCCRQSVEAPKMTMSIIGAARMSLRKDKVL